MITKAFHRFTNRASHFNADLELIDILTHAVSKNELTPTAGQYIFKHIDANKHTTLINRTNNSQSRKLAVSHLKRTIYSAFIKDIFEDVEQYLVDLIIAASSSSLSQDRLVGEHKISIPINDILKCGSWDAVVALVANDLFRKLQEARKTTLVFEQVDKKLGLNLDEQVIKEAMPYLEMRHLLVHSDGKADKKFCESFPDFGYTIGKSIPLNYPVISAAREKITTLVKEIDSKATSKLNIATKYIHGK